MKSKNEITRKVAIETGATKEIGIGWAEKMLNEETKVVLAVRKCWQL